MPSVAHHVGIAGLGALAGELALNDPRAGFFGYDRSPKLDDIKDGTSTTIAVTEVMDGGPWTGGGRATVRGLLPGEQPYLGEAGQFSSRHRGSGVVRPGPVIINVMFVDLSIRPFSSAVSPDVFEALATIAGREQVEGLPD